MLSLHLSPLSGEFGTTRKCRITNLFTLPRIGVGWTGAGFITSRNRSAQKL